MAQFRMERFTGNPGFRTRDTLRGQEKLVWEALYGAESGESAGWVWRGPNPAARRHVRQKMEKACRNCLEVVNLCMTNGANHSTNAMEAVPVRVFLSFRLNRAPALDKS